MIADPKMFELPVQNSDVITEFCYLLCELKRRQEDSVKLFVVVPGVCLLHFPLLPLKKKAWT